MEHKTTKLSGREKKRIFNIFAGWKIQFRGADAAAASTFIKGFLHL